MDSAELITLCLDSLMDVSRHDVTAAKENFVKWYEILVFDGWCGCSINVCRTDQNSKMKIVVGLLKLLNDDESIRYFYERILARRLIRGRYTSLYHEKGMKTKLVFGSAS